MYTHRCRLLRPPYLSLLVAPTSRRASQLGVPSSSLFSGLLPGFRGGHAGLPWKDPMPLRTHHCRGRVDWKVGSSWVTEKIDKLIGLDCRAQKLVKWCRLLDGSPQQTEMKNNDVLDEVVHHKDCDGLVSLLSWRNKPTVPVLYTRRLELVGNTKNAICFRMVGCRKPIEGSGQVHIKKIGPWN